jgi:hypothetical protein
VQQVAATGGCVGAEDERGRHEAGDRPIGQCLLVDVADRTDVATTTVCLFITIQRVA